MDIPFDYIAGLLGGILIGFGTLTAMLATRSIPGISGIFGRILRPSQNEVGWRIVFLLGMIGGAALLFQVSAHAALFRIPSGRPLFVYVIAGLLVGFGTRFGGGCTSGHGICGSGMGARDSMVATAVFVAAGMLTAVLFRTLIPPS